jgi:hypothetical protein
MQSNKLIEMVLPVNGWHDPGANASVEKAFTQNHEIKIGHGLAWVSGTKKIFITCSCQDDGHNGFGGEGINSLVHRYGGEKPYPRNKAAGMEKSQRHNSGFPSSMRRRKTRLFNECGFLRWPFSLFRLSRSFCRTNG